MLVKLQAELLESDAVVLHAPAAPQGSGSGTGQQRVEVTGKPAAKTETEANLVMAANNKAKVDNAVEYDPAVVGVADS